MLTTTLATVLLAALAPAASDRSPSSTNLADSLAAIRAVGPEGKGNAPAAEAWRVVSTSGATGLVSILEAMRGANGFAKNWLRSAVEVLVTREQAAGRSLPLPDLTAFLNDRSQDPQARWLAYRWITQQDPSHTGELLATLLDDPAGPLRREAVARALAEADDLRSGDDRPGAIARYRTALAAARDADQVEAAAKTLRELGETVDLIAQFGWVTHWKVIGPFHNTALAGFQQPFPPETVVQLEATYDGKAGKVAWREFVTSDDYGNVDFNKALGAAKEVTGYGFTEFYSDRERPAEIRLGCKNGWKIWWNGDFVFGRDEYHRGAEIDQYRLPVRMRAGRNTLLVKLCQNEEVEDWTVEWEFQLRITDPTGTPLQSRRPQSEVTRP